MSKHSLWTQLRHARRTKHRVDMQCRELALENRRLREVQEAAERLLYHTELEPWEPGVTEGRWVNIEWIRELRAALGEVTPDV